MTSTHVALCFIMAGGVSKYRANFSPDHEQVFSDAMVCNQRRKVANNDGEHLCLTSQTAVPVPVPVPVPRDVRTAPLHRSRTRDRSPQGWTT